MCIAVNDDQGCPLVDTAWNINSQNMVEGFWFGLGGFVVVVHLLFVFVFFNIINADNDRLACT